MPALKNDRWELFAQGMAKGLTAEEAHVQAGYVRNRGNATRLKANESVMKRIEELRDKGAARALVTVESLSAELEEARGIAIAEKQSSAAVSATMGKAKLFGLGVENKRLTGKVTIRTVAVDDLKELTPDELDRLEQAYPVLEKLGIVGSDSGGEEEAGS